MIQETNFGAGSDGADKDKAAQQMAGQAMAGQTMVSHAVASDAMDSQEITLRSSEARTVSSEECETRVANGRRFHKRTVTTESRESKTEVHESNLPMPSPSFGAQSAGRPAHATAASPLAASTAAVASAAAGQVRLSIANVESLDGKSGGSFVGDYILDPMTPGSGANDSGGPVGLAERRWRLSFPVHCGLFQAELTETRLAGGGVRLSARLSGLEAGPEWSGEARRFDGPTVLRCEVRQVGRPIAGCYWPSHVTVAPLARPVAKQRFHIPPESTLEEILILSGSGGSEDSFDLTLVELGSGSDGGELIEFRAEGSGCHVAAAPSVVSGIVRDTGAA